jgi:hypothetical protein
MDKFNRMDSMWGGSRRPPGDDDSRKANSCYVSNSCSPIGSWIQSDRNCPTIRSERKVVIKVTGVNRRVLEIVGDVASKGLDQADLVVFPDTVLELCKEFVDG